MADAEGAVYTKQLETMVGERTDQLRQMHSDLYNTQNCVLEAYGVAIQLKHPATAAHSRRLVPFTIALGRACQLEPEEILQVSRAAFIHDVGKLAIPDDVLAKGAQLSELEAQTMQRHCVLGYEIVNKVQFLSPIAEMIVAHHEHWDGTGYPNRLQGDAIPKGARMIAVLNTFDNLIHRDAKSLDAALQEITDGAGTLFDPQIVEAFIRVPGSTWQQIATQVES